MGKVITEINLDMLKYIMILVAKSGAGNLARAVAVCRKFVELAEDVDVLKAAVFDDVRLSGRYELFQNMNGLLNRSAHAGSPTAKYMIAKIVLVSSSQLLDMDYKTAYLESTSDDRVSEDQESGSDDPQVDTQVSKQNSLPSSFMSQFSRDQSHNSKVLSKSLNHFELVRLFLLQCSPHDLAEMCVHMQRYFKYYNGSSEKGDLVFFDVVDKLRFVGKYLRAYEEVEKLIDMSDSEVNVRGKLKELKGEVGEEFYLNLKLFYRLNAFLVKHTNQSMEESMRIDATLYAQFEELKDYYMKVLVAMFERKRASMISIFDKSFGGMYVN